MKPKNLILIFVVLIFSYNLCLANLTSEVSFSVSDFSFTSKGEFTLLDLPNAFHTTEVGSPQMPVTSVSFVIPQNVRITGVNILSAEKEPVPDNFYLYPAQEEVPIGMTVPFTEPNKLIYESKNPYPNKIVELAGDGFMAGYHLTGILVYPLEYVPVEHKLYLYSEIKFEILYKEANRECVVPPSGLDRDCEEIVINSVKNPEDILHCRPNPVMAKLAFPPADSIPYVIITNLDMKSAFNNLATWKIKKGTPTEVKTISSIQYDYADSVGDLAAKVRFYIRKMYQQHYTKWVLLGGDISIIPSRCFYTYNWDDVLTDQYYMNLDGNWNLDGDTLYGEMEDSVDLYPEVYVGRVPCVNSGEANNFISKLLSYEKNSPNYDYQTRALFLSSCLWNDPEDQKLLDSVSRVVPGSYTKASLTQYDPSTGISYLNTGYGLITNYSHAQNSGNFLTHYCDGIQSITKSDIDTLKNTNRYSVFLNVTCWNNKLSEDCLSKHFLLHTSSGGGVGYIGSSSSDFPYTTREMHVAFFDQLFNHNEIHIGKTLALAKQPYGRYSSWYVAYPNTWRYTYFSYLLLGDPQMEIWRDTPDGYFIDYPSWLPLDQSTFSVFVYKSRDIGIPNALVCLRKEGQVYELRKTNAPGFANFTVNFTTFGTASLVVSKPGFLPKEVSITIGTPPQGCPMVSTWTGKGFEEDNTILAACELKNRAVEDVTDNYLLKKPLIAKNSNYHLEIRESEQEESFLDNFELLVVNHPEGTKVAVTPTGDIFSYNHEILPISCIDSDGQDQLDAIIREDGIYYTSKSPGYLILTYRVSETLPPDVLLAPVPPPPEDKKIISGLPGVSVSAVLEVLDSNGNWVKILDLPPRENPDRTSTFLDRKYQDPEGNIKLKLSWQDHYSADQIGLYIVNDVLPIIHKTPLVSATHSVKGQVLDELSKIDHNYVTLVPNENIELIFSKEEDDAMMTGNVLRDFVLKSAGYYFRLSDENTVSNQMPDKFTLFANYPNPFNAETVIKYALPIESDVKLTVYNILGEKVRSLVNGHESPGYKTVSWNGRDDGGKVVASGIYFCKLQANSFTQTTKMVMLK